MKKAELRALTKRQLDRLTTACLNEGCRRMRAKIVKDRMKLIKQRISIKRARQSA